MATGCDFTCDNEKCAQHKNGFVMRAPGWPLGDINRIIVAKNVRRNREFQKELVAFRDKYGLKYSCINYPNLDKIPVMGYRVEMWCEKCKRLEHKDIILPDPSILNGKNDEEKMAIMEKAVTDSAIDQMSCPSCNEKMKTYSQLMKDDDGISCPHCNVKMTKNTFFSNETEEEFIKNA